MGRLVTRNGGHLHTATLTLSILAAACSSTADGPGPFPPTPIDQAPRLLQPVAAQVIDGWTNEPVAGATVSAQGRQTTTDAEGRFELMGSGSCVRVTVVAAGYLDRGTCTVPIITLWPIADEAERQATLQTAFFGAWRELHVDDYRGEDVMLAPELKARADIVAVWASAANRLQEATLGRFSYRMVANTDRGFAIIRAGSPTACRFFPWPLEIGGFCWAAGSATQSRIEVLEPRLADARAATRILLSRSFSAHQLPGLVNRTQPDGELSLFERKTLHMIGLRANRTVYWPDYDE